MKRRILRDFILLIVGGIIFSGITTYAAYKYQAKEVGYTPINSNFKVDNVETAINELYKKANKKGPTMEIIQGATHKGIVYLDPTDLTKECTSVEVNTNYTTNGTNGIPTGIKTGCMKWYVINNNGENYTMILDHNTTAVEAWDTSTKNVAYDASSVKGEVNKLMSESEWKSQPRFISTDEVNTITGKTGFDSADNASSYYFDNPNKEDIQTATSQSASSYAWLYNWTKDCTNAGCDVADNSTYGYYTSDTVGAPESGLGIWRVISTGRLRNPGSQVDLYYGIRPVITISKSAIK